VVKSMHERHHRRRCSQRLLRNNAVRKNPPSHKGNEMTMVKCNCEHVDHETGFGQNSSRCDMDKFSLGARADLIGTVCDWCATTHMRDYIIEMLGQGIRDDHYNSISVVVLASGETLAHFYGPYRYEHGRHMLRFVG